MIINKYPLDLTGKNPDNLIIGEPHTLVTNGRDGLRVFVPQQGSFYTESLVVRDSSGTPLTADLDYVATYLYEDASMRTGLEVCGAVVVKNQTIGDEISIDYQCVGGTYAQSMDALEQVLETLASDTRPVEWANIIGKPSVYPAGGHVHALWELYGFEYLVFQLERIHSGILTGDQAMFETVREYARSLFDDGKEYTDQLGVRLDDHINNLTNPHQVTKTQVGLGNVANYPVATEVEAIAGEANDRYMTPALSDSLFNDRAKNLNASNLTSGRLPDARLYGDYTGITSMESLAFLGDPADTVQNPSFTWKGATNTGFYRGSSDQIGITVNGTKIVSFSQDEIWSKGDVRGFSDGRLKRNFVQFEDALERVRRLKGGIYERIDLDGKKQVGLIAQEVLDVVPEVVSKDESGYYGLSYSNLVALLIEAIKDVDTQHRAEIKALRDELLAR